MKTVVEVHAPCRLHFGMFSFGNPDRPQFGGVGVMVEPPCVEIRILPAHQFQARGSLADRTRQFVEQIVSQWKLPSLPSCEIAVQSPPSHIGLGVGTQLGLAIAAGLRRFLHLADLPVEELAASVGRGRRSAVGTHGFQHGGLIVDSGKEAGETIGKLATRVALPDSWRFVLLWPTGKQGLAGTSEAAAFSRLPAVPDEITRELLEITTEQIIPPARRQDCAMFGEAVYRFGRLAGECFYDVQGGPYASPEIARLVGSIREFGVAGVGQSSWGPMVFAVTASDAEAGRLVDWIRHQSWNKEYEILVARANNSGAAVRVTNERI